MQRGERRLTAGLLNELLAAAEEGRKLRVAGGMSLADTGSAGKLLTGTPGGTSEESAWVRTPDASGLPPARFTPAIMAQQPAIAPSTQSLDPQTGRLVGQAFLSDSFDSLRRDGVFNPILGNVVGSFKPLFSSGLGNLAKAGDQVHWFQVAGATGGFWRIVIPAFGVVTAPIGFQATATEVGLALAAAVGLTDLSALVVTSGGVQGKTPPSWTIRFLGLGFEILNGYVWEADPGGLEGQGSQGVRWQNLSITAPRRNRYCLLRVQPIPDFGAFQLFVDGTPTAPQYYDHGLGVYPTTASLHAALGALVGPQNVVVRTNRTEAGYPGGSAQYFRIDFTGPAQYLEYRPLNAIWEFDRGRVDAATLYDPPPGGFVPPPEVGPEAGGMHVAAGPWDDHATPPLGRLLLLTQSDEFDDQPRNRRVWRGAVTASIQYTHFSDDRRFLPLAPAVSGEALPVLSPAGTPFFWRHPNQFDFGFVGLNQPYADPGNTDGQPGFALGEANGDRYGVSPGQIVQAGWPYFNAPLRLHLLQYTGEGTDWIILNPTINHWSGVTWQGYPLCKVGPPGTSAFAPPELGTGATVYTLGVQIGNLDPGQPDAFLAPQPGRWAGVPVFLALNQAGGPY